MECHVSSAAIPRRLPGSTSIYDGVFAGSAHKGRVSSRAEDYAEVFAGGGGQNACRATIPVLDVPCFHEGRLRVDVRGSSLDYLKIFGGGAADGFAASYEEEVGPGAGAKVGGGRIKTKKRSPLLVSNDGLDEASVVQETSILSSNEAKRFNVSYSKSNAGSNGKSNGTVHVAQLADIPGYSVLVEENGILKQGKVNMEQVIKGDVASDTGGGAVKGVNCRNAASGVSVEIPAEQSSRKDISRRRSSKEGSFSDGMLFDRCGFMVGKDSYEEVPSYNFSPASFDKKRETNGRLAPRSVSKGVDGSYSPPDLGSQLDTNSAAAASVTAVKIAIEKAQARIKAAKEIMEGKKVFDFKVRVKKKFDSEDTNGDKKPKKEYRNSKMLHQKVCDEDTQVHSPGGITKQNLAEAELVSGKVGKRVKESTSEESNIVGLEENRDKTRVDCRKRGMSNREEEEDLFEDARAEPYQPERDELREVIGVKNESQSSDVPEDARAEPYQPERDELREVIGVKNENQSSDVPESNCDVSSSRNSAAVVDAEAALDEALCHDKTIPQLLTSVGVKESEEQIIPFELSEELNRRKENTPDSYTVSDDFESVKKFAFHFHVSPFEKLPELKIFDPNIDHESQQLIEHNLVKCAADLCCNNEDDWKDGDDLSDKVDSDTRENLGMTLGNGEVREKQEQYCEVVNGEMQLEEPCTLEENSLEHRGASLGGKPENGVSEIYDPAIPKEWNDQLAVKNLGDCREEIEFGESPDCKEGKSGETVLPDSNQMEDLKMQPEIGDIIETVEVPTDLKARRRRWTVEAHNVSRLINALAANACEPNVHEQVTGTQRTYEHSEGQTADEITDDVEKEDGDRILLENVSPELGDAECVSTGAPYHSMMEGKHTDEPIKSINDTFKDVEINQGGDDAEVFISGENIANIEDACVDFQLTDDEVSDGSSNNDSPAQGAELPPCSGPESESSVKEASSENGVEFSGDDLSCMDETVMNVQQSEKQETQTAEVGMDADKNKENHHATQTTEEVGAEEGPESEMQVKGTRGKNVEEAKEKERAREKERLAVDRAIHEARQRAYAEAKQRAERAAVEKATSEAWQRGIAQFREKVGKFSTESGNKADDQRSVKAKLKAERAAVERATSEARERALEKALAEKLAASDKDSKPGKKSHEQQHRSSGSSSDSRHPSTLDPSANCAERSKGDNGESSQRRKAKLERHQRTAERVAKALAEKNKRDLLAQREQAERNRLAETLDSEIKRWSSGKHGNLRALLSTLQYILGPDSGWQPVTLTEIVTAAAVRKAYRKATLYVHPDKLQQRGASLQQKYICEKVFDLLKDAWNKFGAEER